MRFGALLLILLATPAWGDNLAYDIPIGASTVYMEASGEPPEGQRAVAHVLVNRVKSGRWGHTLASVCLYPLQFSAWNTKDPNRIRVANLPENDPTLKKMESYLLDAMSGASKDPTNGAEYYFNPKVANPPWQHAMIKVATIGNHDFYKEP